MSNTLPVRRNSGVVVRASTLRAIRQVDAAVRTEQAMLSGQARVGLWAMQEAMDLKAVQHELEQLNPDATEVLAILANTTLRCMTRIVERFGQESC